MNVIVTGNIGCGKSTVVQQLKALLPDFAVHNVDVMVRDLYTNPEFIAFLQANIGATEKATVSDIVFKDASLRQLLEKESMKYLNREIATVLLGGNVILEFPLFFEAGGLIKYFSNRHTTKVIAVTCSTETQIQRVMARDGADENKVNRIIAAQLSNELKATMADHVINTELPTATQVETVAADIRLEQAYDLASELKQRALKFFHARGTMAGPNLWRKLLQAYTEQHRAYHTIHHLLAMFKHFDKCVSKGLIHNPVAVELAIWWHDYVYHTDARYADNEAQSARLMYEAMRVDTPAFALAEMWATDVMLASEMILTTKGHVVRSPYLLGDAKRLSDAQYFLDIDLSILGKSAEVIDQFEEDIRFEFKQYAAEQYAAGRSTAMKSFLDRERVYYTDEFYNAYEAKARANLNNIIQKWSTK